MWRYWLGDAWVAFRACFTQMYFVHFLGATHSFVLMLMALDRFVAICDPLRYPTVVTNAAVTVLGGVSWLMPASWMVGVVTQAVTLPYCDSHVIRQCYCDHFSITRLSCDQSQVGGGGVQTFCFLHFSLSPLAENMQRFTERSMSFAPPPNLYI